MSISTMSARPRGVGLGGGWLSMAPQMDDAPIQPQPVGTVEQRPDSNHASPSVPASAQRSPIVPPPRAMNTSAAVRPNTTKPASQSYSQAPQSLVRKPYAAQSQPDYGRLPKALPRTKARFSVGDSTSQPATPASVTPPSPPLSQDGNGDGQDSPPAFDVRNSFAPMRWGTAGPTISSRRSSAAQDGKAGNRLVQGAGANDEAIEGSEANQATKLSGEEDDEEDDGERFEYAGRKWKGKTAQAIELEMEALGDRTVMSYAPDAVYLASRLEGLRRNLEAGGERFRRRWWEDLEEEEAAGQDAQMDSVEDEQVQRTGSSSALDGNAAQPLPSSRRSSSHLSMAMSSPVRDMHIIDPLQDAATATNDSAPLDPVAEGQTAPAQNADHAHATDIDPVAKQAALDARVEIRTLRRPDLEQVRELHCYHGDGDKVDTETYTTSAAFLLRLLVDEHYVCLVAVAKPLPEPPALPPSTLAPRPPPPSLDMPASRAPYMLAGRPSLAAATASNGFAQRSALNKRAVSALPAFLAPTTNADILMHDAPAPRSFGAGPDSSENTSSLLDSSDEEEEERARLGSVQAASTRVTGNTSPPLNDLSDGKDDVSMPDIAEEEEVDEVAVSETENGLNAASPAGTAAALSMRKSSTVTNRPSPRSVLAGPTFDVAPPRAIRVMGAPPLNGMPLESETILGVASARIKVVQRAADDFHLQASEWQAKEAASADMQRSSSKDASWPGLDPKGERSVVTREAHIMTLSVLPEERGQGLGARLLDRLLDECRRRTAGPRIHLAPGSNSTTEDANGEAAAPPRAHQDAPMRTVLEMHPSNTAAVQLYNARKFRQVSGNRGVVKHFFRGDQRIPSSIRLKVGGSDAVRMERIDLSTS